MDATTLREGATVMTRDGTLGRLRHVVVGPETREVTDLVVTDGDRDWLVPASAVAGAAGDRITLSGTRAEYETGAGFDDELYDVVDEDDARDETERRAARGGEPLLDAREEEVTIGRERRAAPARPDGETGNYRLQLREERLRVQKEREQAGTVQLGKRVVEHTETVQVPLREERVVIERHPVNERVEGGAITDSDQTIEVDLMRERAVAEKEAVVIEEVEVRKEAVERTERVSGTVRKEELVVDEQGDVDITGDATLRTTEYEREQSHRG